jgi:hypothetical protein
MEKHKSLIPTEISEVFYRLHNELFILYMKWNSFKTLYCTSDDNIKLLDESAKGFFVMHGDIMRDNIMMSICVLTDPASSRVGREIRNNLTLKHVADIIPSKDTSLIDEVNQLFESAKSPWEPFRSHRNRRIGHYDLNTVLKKTDELLPGVSISDVDTALSLIANVLNAIETFYDNNKTAYHHGIYQEGNAKELMDFLKRSADLEMYHNHKEFGDTLDGQ